MSNPFIHKATTITTKRLNRLQSARYTTHKRHLMKLHGIDIPEHAIEQFCRQHRIRRLALFGSIVRDDFTHDSDIDMLVEFEPGATPGFAFFTLQRELSKIIGHPVDLNTPAELSPYFREQVLHEAEVLYDAA